MKNIVDAAAFYKAMTALMEVPSKSSIEVLREIKAEFTGDQCVLSATDLNTWMSVTLPASGDSFGFVFRNSANIQKICRHYDGALELELQQIELLVYGTMSIIFILIIFTNLESLVDLFFCLRCVRVLHQFQIRFLRGMIWLNSCHWHLC